jgi:hypothetical protein
MSSYTGALDSSMTFFLFGGGENCLDKIDRRLVRTVAMRPYVKGQTGDEDDYR